MTVRKIAISVPEEILREIDAIARKSKTTRSGLISQVLSEVTHARNRSEVTARINQLFGDPEIQAEQATDAGIFLQAADSDSEGSGWS